MLPPVVAPTGLDAGTLRGWFWETTKPLIPQLIGAKAGVCTSFAATAVTVLLSDANVQQSRPRMEYVAAPNHCICLVNRTPDVRDLPDGTITPYAGWNPGVVIVDPWAGAMGYHVISIRAN